MRPRICQESGEVGVENGVRITTLKNIYISYKKVCSYFVFIHFHIFHLYKTNKKKKRRNAKRRDAYQVAGRD